MSARSTGSAHASSASPGSPTAQDPPELAAFLAAYDEALSRWPVPAEAITVRTPHGTTRVNACGPRDGRPLVLLHGGGATSTGWTANAEALAAAGHRVLAVDLIGDPGRSVLDAPLGGVEGLMSWLDAVLDGLGVAEADLCGHSYGGWIALEFALHAPPRVRRLVLLDPTQCFAGFRPGYLLRVLPLFLPPRTAGKARSYLTWEARGTGSGTAAEAAWRELYALGFAGFPAARPVTGPRPAPERLRALTAPTLVLLAARSRTHDARRVADLAQKALPGATVDVLPDASHHTLPAAHPAELNRRLTEFLAAGA
ncbi:alpha/beta hydrolase [Kitasatospora sp. CM 4170]|uniref:Alpha/beta fold hydrolase n=1 Tax=Kitasatospora aburaviensis TaxID=67265 RepID=A0ABW1F0Z7_9ACTN|nr:alpha/beta hydrolase [Kitasatospora sp. CM 4170]WNM48950.1 alpha/beta hydrolase [Kitasatospora sp. CM 4170]